MWWRGIFAGGLLTLSVFGPASGGPLEDGQTAAGRNDYLGALRLWRPLAEQGNAAAQVKIGWLYNNGLGVPQDYLQAHMWLSLAASGTTDAAARDMAIKNRDLVAAKMTSTQIAEAQKMAREMAPKKSALAPSAATTVVAPSRAGLTDECLAKYKIISDQFYVYNEKSAVSNAIMDRINTYYVEGSDFSNIKPPDAEAWRAATQDAIAVGQPMLQNLLEYRAYGCIAGPDQRAQVDKLINKETEDLKIGRARLNALVSGLPLSKFQ
jgi:TPR repeat protein